jgi:AcrR family transcriptional regulator
VARPAVSRREQNKLEKRARIIAAARALFAHKGFEATTTQEVAYAADVAVGTLFVYAKTKEDLLIQVFHEEMVDVVERAFLAARRRRALIDQLTTFFQTLVDYHEQDRPLAQVLMRQLSYVQNKEQRAAVVDLMGKLLRRLAMLIDAAKTRGEVGNDKALTASAEADFAIYFHRLGMLLNGYISRERFDRDLPRQLTVLMAGLR